MSNETSPLLNKTREEKKGNIQTYPPIHEQHRNLVLLFDGTGDTDDEDISNVIALRNMLHPHQDPSKQLLFYQPGIGTYNPYFPGLKIKIPLISTISRALDNAIAWSLDHHVVEAYEWLMNHYQDGDKICMFGFSRGAYTARAISAMIHKFGLLPLTHIDKVWDAYESYSLEGPGSWAHSSAFRKETGSRAVIIEFVGVWDTVNSVGLIGARKLHHTASNGSLRTFRHAEALDEHRARFRSNMWSPPSICPTKRPQHFVVTDVDQVWFAGCHCDAGGGSVPNGTRPNLAHIALRWMVRECSKTKTGLRFDPAEIRAIGIDPDSLYPVVKPRPPLTELSNDHRISTKLILQPSYFQKVASWVTNWFKPLHKHQVPDFHIYDNYVEEHLDLLDALAPIYDQLVINKKMWWILENMWLRRYSLTNKKKVWNRNLGRGRMIPVPHDPSLTDPSTAALLGQVAIDPRWSKIRVHRTVKTRMTCTGDIDIPQYVPLALLKNEMTLDVIDSSLIEWVD